jgi:hypothetical protein
VRDCAGAVSIGQASGLTRRYRSGNRGAWLLQRDLLAFQATYLSVGESERCRLARRYQSGNQGAWLLQCDLLAFQATYLSVGESERFSCALPAGSRWPRSLEIAYSAMQQAIPLQE